VNERVPKLFDIKEEQNEMKKEKRSRRGEEVYVTTYNTPPLPSPPLPCPALSSHSASPSSKLHIMPAFHFISLPARRGGFPLDDYYVDILR
jgi:hypothetical protein